MAELPAFDAVSLDVGGVLVVPDRGMLGDALTRSGVPHDRDRFFDGHYRAMAEVDRCRSRPEEFTDYTRALARAVGVIGSKRLRRPWRRGSDSPRYGASPCRAHSRRPVGWRRPACEWP
jgi:hypothetical protein